MADGNAAAAKMQQNAQRAFIKQTRNATATVKAVVAPQTSNVTLISGLATTRRLLNAPVRVGTLVGKLRLRYYNYSRILATLIAIIYKFLFIYLYT